MQDSRLLFEWIMSLARFKYSHIVLFLTKVDLFEKKVPHAPVSDYFPDYTGSDMDSSHQWDCGLVSLIGHVSLNTISRGTLRLSKP